MILLGRLSQDGSEGFWRGHGPAPRGQRGSLGFVFVAKEIVEADCEVAQGDQITSGIAALSGDFGIVDVGAFGTPDTTGVFAQGDVAGSVNAIFDARPVTDDGIEHGLVVEFGLGAAGDVACNLGLRELLGFGFGEVNGCTFDGGNLPTPAKSDFLWTDFEGFDATAHQRTVAFFPGTIFLRREKKRARVCTRPAQGYRFDFP